MLALSSFLGLSIHHYEESQQAKGEEDEQKEANKMICPWQKASDVPLTPL